MLHFFPTNRLAPGIAIKTLGLSLTCLVLCQCGAPVSVGTRNPVAPIGAPAGQSDPALQLSAVHSAYQRIQRGDEAAMPAYNYAVARLIESIGKSGSAPWHAPGNFSMSEGIQTFTMRAPEGLDLDHFKLIPTDTLEFKGKHTEYKSIIPGIGAPLVAIDATEQVSRLTHEVHRKHIPLRNLTAIVRFEGDAAILELVDPYQKETITLAGRSRPLAANFGAAIMFGLSKTRVDKLGIVRLLRPSRYNDTVHINFLQPYDPKRIPVLFIHGLDSTPATFAPMYFKLLEDREIREHYQFWVFSYPSGYPYPYSASLLRKELAHVNQAFPDHKDMVVIGHSMGSMLSRAIVTDADEQIWQNVFGKPVAQTTITGSSRQILEESLVFTAQPKIDRVVFYSGPHRGSDLAVDWIGRFFGKLVRLPGTMADMRDAIVSATIDPAAEHLTRSPNSIDTLAPDNYFVIEINKIPIRDGITYHTVAGDRGKGDSPNSSDGVVPYWSSHLEGAASEKIVPSGHGSHEHPEGIEEARRILKLHLENAR
jgi:pimeloyl-ACP methyl ester carboxylesterase